MSGGDETSTAAPSPSLGLGRKVLRAQPFSELLGAELTRFEPGAAELVIPIRDALKQQNGFVHGGVLSYAADNALTFAGGSVLGAAVLTSEYKISYLRPALGERLIARASVIHAGRSQAVCRCDIFVETAQGERLCATAMGTIARAGAPPAAAPAEPGAGGDEGAACDNNS